MHTRQDYVSGTVSHRKYYAQFVTNSVKIAIRHRIGTHRLSTSQDPHLNDIPLYEWDSLFLSCPPEITARMAEADDYPTPAGLVCTYKEAARQILEELTINQQ